MIRKTSPRRNRLKSKMRKEKRDHETLMKILEKDFEELNGDEMFRLRNEIRKRYKLGAGSIDTLWVLNMYLMLKRENYTEHEMLLIKPRYVTTNFGVFGGGVKTTREQVLVQTFDGLKGVSKTVLSITSDTYLPLLTVSFNLEECIATCIAPDGHFCNISSKEFDFKI